MCINHAQLEKLIFKQYQLIIYFLHKMKTSSEAPGGRELTGLQYGALNFLLNYN